VTIDDPRIAPAPTAVNYEWVPGGPGTPLSIWLLIQPTLVACQNLLTDAFNGVATAGINYNGVVTPKISACPGYGVNTLVVRTSIATGDGSSYAIADSGSEWLTFNQLMSTPGDGWLGTTSTGQMMPRARQISRWVHRLTTEEATAGGFLLQTRFAVGGGMASIATLGYPGASPVAFPWAGSGPGLPHGVFVSVNYLPAGVDIAVVAWEG
jgi:hypothetical protein